MSLLAARGRRARPLPGIEDAWTRDDGDRRACNAVSDIVAVLDGVIENPSTGVEAARSLDTIVAFYNSHCTGSRVSIPFVRPLKDGMITSR
ncbi:MULTISPECIES: hypothetical protein [Haloarcula]|uniref:hypothetical protein n=1 Tax=Haloarcula TaxID=2237 RepID=UPI0023EBCA2A|nr:hypothetical protein [Halomicroarcula sp. XH51]